MSEAAMEMPRYVCHKRVWALKIERVDEPPAGMSTEFHGVLVFDDKRYAALPVTAEYMQKHAPQAGGYYVVYADGYKSFSPAKAFEDGYTREGAP